VQAHIECYSQFTYNNNKSDLGAPEEQDFTINSPHLSGGLTPVLVPETLSAHSGEDLAQSSALRSTTPSQENRQSQMKLTQTSQIQDWDKLMPQQQQEALSWGIDIDISTDSDNNMSGQAGGSATVTMAPSGSGGGSAPGGGGGPPGGGGGGGGGGLGPPAPLPTLDDLTRLLQDMGNVVGILAQQVLDLTRDHTRGRGGAKDLISCPKPWDGKGGSAEARHFLAAFHNFHCITRIPIKYI
jgi:hypothetical protein